MYTLTSGTTGLLGSSPNSLHSLALASTALLSAFSAEVSAAVSAEGSAVEVSAAAGASPIAPRTELSAETVEPAVSSDVADTTDILEERAVDVRCSSRRCSCGCCDCSLLRGDVAFL
jgi:hypothetical protein